MLKIKFFLNCFIYRFKKILISFCFFLIPKEFVYPTEVTGTN